MIKFRAATAAIALGACVAGATAGAQAQEQAPHSRPAAFQAIVDCRAIQDSAQRLACYDAAAARLEQAESAGDVVVVDRAQVTAARREAFGFSLPSLNVFNRGPALEKIESLESTVMRAADPGNGRWVITLANNQVWRKTDDKYARVRQGMSVRVETGVLGSYFMKVDGKSAFRVERVR